MLDPNVIGHVVEFCSDKDAHGNQICRLRINLRNTLGEAKVIWVDGPNDLAEFFASGEVA